MLQFVNPCTDLFTGIQFAPKSEWIKSYMNPACDIARISSFSLVAKFINAVALNCIDNCGSFPKYLSIYPTYLAKYNWYKIISFDIF